MSDLQRVLSEAQKAREEAELASRRAADLEAQAEAASARARQERDQRRRAWAQGIVDAYESDLTGADAAIQAAQERFDAVAVENLPGATEAYLAWGEAAIRHYVLQVRVGTAAQMLDMDASQAEFASPPPFSEALDQAMGRHLAQLSAQAREDAAEEIGRRLDAEDSELDASPS